MPSNGVNTIPLLEWLQYAKQYLEYATALFLREEEGIQNTYTSLYMYLFI